MNKSFQEITDERTLSDIERIFESLDIKNLQDMSMEVVGYGDLDEDSLSNIMRDYLKGKEYGKIYAISFNIYYFVDGIKIDTADYYIIDNVGVVKFQGNTIEEIMKSDSTMFDFLRIEDSVENLWGVEITKINDAFYSIS